MCEIKPEREREREMEKKREIALQPHTPGGVRFQTRDAPDKKTAVAEQTAFVDRIDSDRKPSDFGERQHKSRN